MIAPGVTVLASVVLAAPQLKVDLGASTGAHGGVGVVSPSSAGVAGWVRPELAARARVGNAELEAEYAPSFFRSSHPDGGVAHAGKALLDIDAAPGRRILGGLGLFIGPRGVRFPTGELTEPILAVRSWHSFDANLALWQELTRRLRLTMGVSLYSGGALDPAEQTVEPNYYGRALIGELEYEVGRNDLLRPRIELGRSFHQHGAENFGDASASWVHLLSADFRLGARAGVAAVARLRELGAQLFPVLGVSAEREVRWRTRRLELAPELELAPRHSPFVGRKLLSASAGARARWILRERLRVSLRLGGTMAAASSVEERRGFAALGLETSFLRDFGLTANASVHRRLVRPAAEPVAPWAWVAGFGVSWRMRDLFPSQR
jgi:hypothetical protein